MYLPGKLSTMGVYHVYNSFLKRTHLVGVSTDGLIQENVSAPVYKVVAYYILNPPVLDFYGMGIDFQIRIQFFLLIFLAATLIWLLFVRRLRINGDCAKINALSATLWISILAPLSWFVIFKGHSYVHKVHDPIVWFMPFMFYGIGLLGVATEKFLRSLWVSKSIE